MNKQAILLHAQDNCVVVLEDVAAGDTVAYEGGSVVAGSSVSLGHKIAIRSVPKGGKILKYGAIIGSATQDIESGTHVHTHNLGSDYLFGFHD